MAGWGPATEGRQGQSEQGQGEEKPEYRAGGGAGGEERGGAREKGLRWRLWGLHFLYLLGSENKTEVPQLPQPPSHKSPRQRFSSWLSLGSVLELVPACRLLEGTKRSQGGRGGRQEGSHLETSIRDLWPSPVPSQGGTGDGSMHLFLSDIPVLAVGLPQGMRMRTWREGAHGQRGLIPSCTAPSSPGHSTAPSS